MKNLLIIMLFAILASCTVSKPVISTSQLNDKTTSTINQITAFDTYKISEKKTDNQNDVVVAGATYSRFSGYSNLLQNDTRYNDAYIFKNVDNDIASFEVSYKLAVDRANIPYVYNVAVTNCKTDNINHYDIICGSNGFIKSLKTIQPDQSGTFYDANKTYLTIAGVSLGLSLLLCIPLLTL